MSLPVIDPAQYDSQLEAKCARIAAQFAPLGAPMPDVYRSPPLHYRMRTEFSCRRSADGQLDYVMFEAPGQPVVQRDFPAGSERINRLMADLHSRINREPVLGEKLFQVEFLTTLSGDALVTLVYHRRLDDSWAARAAQLEIELGAAVIGRSRGQRRVISRDHVTETLQVDGRDWQYRQIEGGFSQPNAAVNRQMLAWASRQARDLGGDLLELYCGNGNFTLVLAQHFERVLATEMSKTSVAAALHNLGRNAVDNVAIARLASAEVAQALAGVREFRRLQRAGVNLADYRFSTVFVDPPRAGLDPETLALVSGFRNILYISCNPDTLAANIEALADTHRIQRLALFDQFPYTHHVECGALLTRRDATAG